jgi:hypothetical protein
LEYAYISPNCSAHGFITTLAPNEGIWNTLPKKGNPLGPGGKTYFLPFLSFFSYKENSVIATKKRNAIPQEYMILEFGDSERSADASYCGCGVMEVPV